MLKLKYKTEQNAVEHFIVKILPFSNRATKIKKFSQFQAYNNILKITIVCLLYRLILKNNY